MSTENPTAEDRCRLVIVASDDQLDAYSDQSVSDCLNAADIASIIIYCSPESPHFAAQCERIVGIAQPKGCPVIVADDSQAMGRTGADGLHISSGLGDVRDAVQKFTPQKMIGGGGLLDRHNALILGEAQPDYVFFGRLGGDTHPTAHKKNLKLAEWWAAHVEIPCVVMAGTDPESVVDVCRTGAEFVALSSAIFPTDSCSPSHPAEVALLVNKLLDEHGPRFDSEI
ncbi:MAG: thiamine phosphate synthase [Pseudomonadota bacterium]